MTAADSALELTVSRLIARARLLERALHDQAQWFTIVPGYVPARMQREIIAREGRIVLTAHICENGPLAAADLWCGGHLATVVSFPPGTRSPCRITVEVGVRETAAVGE